MFRPEIKINLLIKFHFESVANRYSLDETKVNQRLKLRKYYSTSLLPDLKLCSPVILFAEFHSAGIEKPS